MRLDGFMICLLKLPFIHDAPWSAGTPAPGFAGRRESGSLGAGVAGFEPNRTYRLQTFGRRHTEEDAGAGIPATHPGSNLRGNRQRA